MSDIFAVSWAAQVAANRPEPTFHTEDEAVAFAARLVADHAAIKHVTKCVIYARPEGQS